MLERPSPHDLTGAYVLHALDAPERARFERHLASCARCTSEVATLREVTASLGTTSDATVPHELRTQALAAIATTPQDPPAWPAGSDVVDRRRPRGVLVGLTAAASVLAVAVAVLVGVVDDLQGRLDALEVTAAAARTDADDLVALIAAEDVVLHTVRVEDVRGRIIASADLGEVVFLVEGLPPAPAAHTYELWTIEADGPRPAGLIEPDADGRVTEHLTGVTSARAIGVTIEPDGGSPAPTTDPMMVVDLG